MVAGVPKRTKKATCELRRSHAQGKAHSGLCRCVYVFSLHLCPPYAGGMWTNAKLDSSMWKAEKGVGSCVGTTGQGMSGSITASGLTRMLRVMASVPVEVQHKVFIDIGAGIGRPQVASEYMGVWPLTYGIEIDKAKCKQARSFVPRVREIMFVKHGVTLPVLARHGFLCANVQNMRTLEPGTHLFSAWEGNFDPDLKACVGRLFAKSRTAHVMAVVQKCMARSDSITPAGQMEEWGFGKVELVADGHFDVSMQGSGCGLQAYIFKKVRASESAGVVPRYDVAEGQWAKAKFAQTAVQSRHPDDPLPRMGTRAGKT